MIMDWQIIIIGLRKRLGLSHEKLANKIGVSRRSVGKYELGERKPNKEIQEILLEFIKNNNLNIKNLEITGKSFLEEAASREKSRMLNLSFSKELAEFIGIILGDGEIHKDGTIRISFDPKKDENFLYRRVFVLIERLLGNEISFESDKRVAFYNKDFVKFLEFECNLGSGSKSKSNISIPDWCLESKEYVKSVLRGLFDTDGYFGHWGGSIELMFGRFSDRCTNLVKDIEMCLTLLGIGFSTKHTKDGRYRIRMHSQRDIIRFFNMVGTSNIKHIVRFLLWRIARYEARIEIEGMKGACRKLNKLINIKISRTPIPFIWLLGNNETLNEYIKEDEAFLKSGKPWSRKRKLKL